ncbi:tetratricopeptide repeat protein [Corallococcus sp. AB050B]|nr:tetratricopeptide repeat protein [Corallococcus sp. AB050B]
MQYALDARLLPPSGASVQCTRCGHVFMASPNGVMAPAPKIPPAGGGERTGGQSSTQIFGGEGASSLKSTNLFAGSTTASGSFVPQPTPPSGALASSGVIPPPPSIAPVSPGAQPPAAMGSTRAFGAVGAPAPAGAPPVQPPAPGAAPGATTRAFGAVSASSSGSFRIAEPGASARGPVAEGGGATRAFGAVPDAPASGAPDGGSAATRAFGAVPDAASEPRAPSRSFENISPSGDPTDPPWSAASGSRARLVPEGHGGSPWATSSPTSTVSLPDDDAPFARTEPSKSAVPDPNASLLGGGLDRPIPPRRPSGDLPPELLGASSRPAPMVIEDGARRASTLSRVLLVLAVLAGIVLAGYLAYPAFRDRNSAMPVEAVSKKEAAVRSLRLDDAASREQAIQSLKALATAHPKYAEVQAELAVAHALQLSDLHAEFDRLRIQADALKRQADDVTAAKASPQWMGEARALRLEMSALEREMQPLRTDIAARRKEFDALVETLRAAPDVEPAATVASRLKAQALHASVTGASNALALAERLRQVEPTPAWSVLARAEYALSSGSPAATLKAVSEELGALRSQDRLLLRAYVLGARLAIRQGDPDTARTLLDEVVALNPKHDLAKRMLAQTPAAEASP